MINLFSYEILSFVDTRYMLFLSARSRACCRQLNADGHKEARQFLQRLGSWAKECGGKANVLVGQFVQVAGFG